MQNYRSLCLILSLLLPAVVTATSSSPLPTQVLISNYAPKNTPTVSWTKDNPISINRLREYSSISLLSISDVLRYMETVTSTIDESAIQTQVLSHDVDSRPSTERTSFISPATITKGSLTEHASSVHEPKQTELRLAPGLEIPPSTTPALPRPSYLDLPPHDETKVVANVGGDQHASSLTSTDGQSQDGSPYPAPVHKLIILGVAFLSFIGLVLGIFALTRYKQIRSYLAYRGEPKPTDEEMNGPSEKQDDAPVAKQVNSHTRTPALTASYWLSLPNQIVAANASRRPPLIPSKALIFHKNLPAPPPRHRHRIVDITPNFPRSRFSEFSDVSEHSDFRLSTLSEESEQESEEDLADAMPMVVDDESARRSGVPMLGPAEFFASLSSSSLNTARNSTISLANAQPQEVSTGGLEQPRSNERWSMEPQRNSGRGLDTGVSFANDIRV